MKILPLSALSMTLLLSPWAGAAPPACSKQSPAHTVALLELYTSEGCNSCPPADRFVSGLQGKFTPDQVVPLSLHVDYWDYIGWKDLFASPAFTQRQQWLSAIAGSRTVYTPEIFLAGSEYRRWQSGIEDAVRRINSRPAQAGLSVALGKPAMGALPVEISTRAPGGSRLFVALYENGIASSVKAGENRGVTLKHDFVVRDWIGPVAVSGDTRARLPRLLQLPQGAQEKNLGVAAFIQDERGEVLQALALPLCSG